MLRKLLLILPTAAIAFNSCKTPRYIYSPSPPNIPFFKDKGDSKIAAYYSEGEGGGLPGEKNEGYDLQVAYAITDHWAATASYFNRREMDTYPKAWGRGNIFDSSSLKYKRQLTEFGGGYFFALDKKRRAVFFNFYAGIGFGHFSFTDNGVDDTSVVYSRYHDSRILKWYMQPGFTIMPGKYIRFSFNTRISYVNYSNISTSYSKPELDFFNLSRIINRTILFVEPSATMQVVVPKCEWLRLEGGIVFSSDPYDLKTVDARNFCGFFGLSFDFFRQKKK